MKVAVQDANIIIDLIDCGIFELLFRLELAEARRACLLTGDGRLRKAAKSSDVDVRGILWVFDQLIGSGLLSKAEARARLTELKVRNQRLPKAEIEKRLKAWGG